MRLCKSFEKKRRNLVVCKHGKSTTFSGLPLRSIVKKTNGYRN